MSFRLDAQDTAELLTVASYPFMEEETRAEIRENYRFASTDLLAEFAEDNNNDYKGIEVLKRNL